MRPGADLLSIAQDRVAEKRFARAMGLSTAPWGEVGCREDLLAAIDEIGVPCVLKTRRVGYDGKGQRRIDDPAEAEAAWAALGEVPCVLEGFVDFFAEGSVIVARRPAGEVKAYPLVENVHRDHILHQTWAPPRFTGPWAAQAETAACRLAAGLGLEGLLAVEFFLSRAGEVLVNELAPRPHNSGHWTMDGCETDQFEQLVRAVCDLPLGPVGLRHPTVMTNLIGDEIGDWHSIVSEPGAQLHHYGKGEARPGRKMGHVNRRWDPARGA
jgi:5-(carboxyamino)imidazole ribonucleotide synthase